MASAQASSIVIRIPIELKKKLDEHRHPGQTYAGVLQELLMTANATALLSKIPTEDLLDYYNGRKGSKRGRENLRKYLLLRAKEDPDIRKSLNEIPQEEDPK